MSGGVEYATGPRGVETFRGLAKSRALPLDVVLRAAAEGRLGWVVRQRKLVENTSMDGSHVGDDPIAAMQFLRSKEILFEARIRRALAS